MMDADTEQADSVKYPHSPDAMSLLVHLVVCFDAYLRMCGYLFVRECLNGLGTIGRLSGSFRAF